MHRIFRGIVIASMAALAIGMLHVGRPAMPMFAQADLMMASGCMDDGQCGSHGNSTRMNCADHCLATGTVIPDAGIMTLAVALAVVALAFQVSGERLMLAFAMRGHHPSIGRMLALERVATDIMRN